MREDLKEKLKVAMFDVEHALSMYATGYCTIPAEAIYDHEALASVMSTIQDCHIYLIGLVPRIVLEDARLENGTLSLFLSALGVTHEVQYDCPEESRLQFVDGIYHVVDAAGNKGWPSPHDVQARLSSTSKAIDFDVKYIGQAYGKDGSRNALDRLLKHETLQKIALKGIPDTHTLTLLLLKVVPNNQLFTVFNPFAKKKDDDGTRIRAGLDKLFETNEQERITLYEASLIRYFLPEYNKEFKNSFPSTNLKVLQDCYEKDFSAVVAANNGDIHLQKSRLGSVCRSRGFGCKSGFEQVESVQLINFCRFRKFRTRRNWPNGHLAWSGGEGGSSPG